MSHSLRWSQAYIDKQSGKDAAKLTAEVKRLEGLPFSALESPGTATSCVGNAPQVGLFRAGQFTSSHWNKLP